MRVLITRPREDAAPLAARLAAKGIDSLIEPLLLIHLLPGAPLDLAGLQGLLVTSANGVRAFAARQPDRDIPVYAVGDASARAAGVAVVVMSYGYTRIPSAELGADRVLDGFDELVATTDALFAPSAA